MKNLILIVTGPSGAGKSTLLRSLPEDQFYFSVSHTTRKPRPNEIHGRDYYFVSKEEFLQMIERDEFLEWIEVHSNFYGTAKSEITKAFSQNKHLLLDLEVVGAANLKAKFGPDAVAVFIAPPSLKVLEERLRKRGTEDEDKVKERLHRAKTELTYAPLFDYVIVNEYLEKAVRDFLSIVQAELCRPWRQDLSKIY